jgi:hypothetical protein
MELGVFIPIGNNGWLISTTSRGSRAGADASATDRRICSSLKQSALDRAQARGCAAAQRREACRRLVSRTIRCRRSRATPDRGSRPRPAINRRFPENERKKHHADKLLLV